MPMYGTIIAFKEFRPNKGIVGNIVKPPDI